MSIDAEDRDDDEGQYLDILRDIANDVRNSYVIYKKREQPGSRLPYDASVARKYSVLYKQVTDIFTKIDDGGKASTAELEPLMWAAGRLPGKEGPDMPDTRANVTKFVRGVCLQDITITDADSALAVRLAIRGMDDEGYGNITGHKGEESIQQVIYMEFLGVAMGTRPCPNEGVIANMVNHITQDLPSDTDHQLFLQTLAEDLLEHMEMQATALREGPVRNSIDFVTLTIKDCDEGRYIPKPISRASQLGQGEDDGHIPGQGM